VSDYQLFHGDCLDVMAGMEDNSIDSIVCDPPAGISFMGKKWDGDKGGRNAWIAWMASIAAECLRVLKPGGHAFVWALPRTSHWTATAWEDAGFEVRDRVAHVFGSGFPKSLDVSKAIDKAAGAEREVVGVREDFAARAPKNNFDQFSATNPSENGINTRSFAQKMGQLTAPATPAAQQWDGWGTALKPAMEDWWLFRKPLAERTVAANVLKFGTGAINVDGCRVGHNEPLGPSAHGMAGKQAGIMGKTVLRHRDNTGPAPQGRWPANLILSYPEDEYDDEGNLLPNPGKDEVLEGFPVTTSGALNAGHKQGAGSFGKIGGETILRDYGGDTGSAARFYYVAKSSKRDRDEGCEGLPLRGKNEVYGNGLNTATKLDPALHTVESVANRPQRNNHHPTVKPTALMQYLCRLITPPGGKILDPFCGSGSTGKGAVLEGFRFIGIEQDAEYIEIARRRIEWAFQQAHPTTGEFVTKAGRAEDTDGLPMFGGEQ
jgi:DNA modification methylase